jgi:hypothetical protein
MKSYKVIQPGVRIGGRPVAVGAILKPGQITAGAVKAYLAVNGIEPVTAAEAREASDPKPAKPGK